jgi:hypothetical protein
MDGRTFFGGAGVSPAIFPCATLRKNAGETPALQHIAMGFQSFEI